MNFASDGGGKLRYEGEIFGDLEVGDVSLAEPSDLLLLKTVARVELDPGAEFLSHPAVSHAKCLQEER